MGEVIDINDHKFNYLMDGQEFEGVSYDSVAAHIEIADYDHDNVTVRGYEESCISKNDLKELMIMWLALNYPDVLKFDEE